jgi:hypothetical protein
LEKAKAVTIMKYFLTFILTVSFLCINCTRSNTNSQNTKYSSIDDNIGHRYTLIGDFNGDGQLDTLIESYQHKQTNQEIPKLQIGARLNKEAIKKIMAQEPKTSLISKNNTISNYLISAEPQQLGLAHLKNEGDLNGDGADDISYVVLWADMSSLNKCHLLSWNGKNWVELDKFDIRDDMLAPLPTQKEEPVTNNFIQKLDSNLVRIHWVNEEGLEEFSMVNLKTAKKIPANNIPVDDRFLITGDSINVPSFELNFDFSSEINKLLNSKKESVMVQIDMSAKPLANLSTSQKNYYDDEMDEIKLGSFSFELYKDGKFIFANKKISRAAFESIQNLNFDVTINCFSGRKSSDLNLFKIDFVNEKILNLNAKPSKVSGSLL